MQKMKKDPLSNGSYGSDRTTTTTLTEPNKSLLLDWEEGFESLHMTARFSGALMTSPTTSPPAQAITIFLILFRMVCFVYKYDIELYIDKYVNDMIDTNCICNRN